MSRRPEARTCIGPVEDVPQKPPTRYSGRSRSACKSSSPREPKFGLPRSSPPPARPQCLLHALDLPTERRHHGALLRGLGGRDRAHVGASAGPAARHGRRHPVASSGRRGAAGVAAWPRATSDHKIGAGTPPTATNRHTTRAAPARTRYATHGGGRAPTPSPPRRIRTPTGVMPEAPWGPITAETIQVPQSCGTTARHSSRKPTPSNPRRAPGRFGPCLATCGQIWQTTGQIRPESADRRQVWSHIGQTLASIHHFWTNSDRCCPIKPENAPPNLIDIGQMFADFGLNKPTHASDFPLSLSFEFSAGFGQLFVWSFQPTLV